MHGSRHEGRARPAPLRQKLPQRLRELRERCELSEYAVATGVGVSQPTYHLIETGVTALSLARLSELADFYAPYGYTLAAIAKGYTMTAAERRTVRAYASLRSTPKPEAVPA